MKKTSILIIIFLASFIGLKAQTLTFEHTQIEGNGSKSAASIDINNYLSLSGANKAIDLNWVYATYDFPAEWTFAMCTGEACWGTQESIVPIAIAPETPVDTKMQFKPNGVQGTGYATLTFTDSSDPSVSATATFIATASNTTGVQFVAVEPIFSFYPNPVVDIMNIELKNYPAVAKIAIYNLVGKEVKSIYTDDNVNTINTTDLIQGMYLITLEDRNGKLLETRRFSKVY